MRALLARGSLMQNSSQTSGLLQSAGAGTLQTRNRLTCLLYISRFSLHIVSDIHGLVLLGHTRGLDLYVLCRQPKLLCEVLLQLHHVLALQANDEWSDV